MSIFPAIFFSPEKTVLNTVGIVFDLGGGRLISAKSSPFSIDLSTDGGDTWENVYLDDNNFRKALLHYIAHNGYIYFGNSVSGTAGFVIRSKDNGATFEKVLTVESSSVWGMDEDSLGNLYIGEYSAGLGDENELYGWNIWKSEDDGDTWTKFFTTDTGTRHCHTVYVDSDDRIMAAWGEVGSGTYGGRIFYLNDNGTVGNEIVNNMRDSGWLSMLEVGNYIYATGDWPPNRIVRFIKGTTDTVEEVINLTDRFGYEFDSPMYKIIKGLYGVLYAVTSGESGTRPILLMSPDDGDTWFAHELESGALEVTANMNPDAPKIYIQIATGTFYFTDYTKAVAGALPKNNPSWSTLTIKTS